MGSSDARVSGAPTMRHESQSRSESQLGTPDVLQESTLADESTTEKLSKADRIEQACKRDDIVSLATLSRSKGGLLSDELRRKAWPILLGFRRNKRDGVDDKGSSIPEESQPSVASLPAHRDEEQVKLDVNRSFVYYPKAMSDAQLDARREDLFDVIIPTLRRYPKLCYFQGFHDIAQVMLLVLGKDDAIPAASYLSLLRIRDFMLPSLSPSLVHLQLLPAIIFAADPALYKHLQGIRPFFALAATLTLYAHEVEDYAQIARLYDFLLAHEAAVSIYLFAVIILSRKQQLLEIPSDDPDLLNFALSKLPRPLDLERLITDAMEVFSKHPPHKLPFRAWRKISASSVLKTTQSASSQSGRVASSGIVNSEITLVHAEELFSKQLVELKRKEQRKELARWVWRYRKPMTGLLAAFAVAGISIWMQQSGLEHWSLASNLRWIAMRSPFRRL